MRQSLGSVCTVPLLLRPIVSRDVSAFSAIGFKMVVIESVRARASSLSLSFCVCVCVCVFHRSCCEHSVASAALAGAFMLANGGSSSGSDQSRVVSTLLPCYLPHVVHLGLHSHLRLRGYVCCTCRSSSAIHPRASKCIEIATESDFDLVSSGADFRYSGYSGYGTLTG